MSFLNPILAAVGLGCIALPILIHILMRRRRKPVAWGAMKFLEEAFRRQRKRTRFEQLLLLAARCLLVAALALALGRPLLGAAGVLGRKPARTVYLLVDNSIAAGVSGASGGTALSAHKARGLELIQSLSAARGDRVAVLSLAGPAQAVVLPAASDLAAAAELVRGLEQEDSRADLRGALEIVASAGGAGGDSAKGAEIIVLSEFRAGSFDVRAAAPTLPSLRESEVAFAPAVSTPVSNTSVRSVELLQPLVMSAQGTGAGAPLPVRVMLARSGAGLERESNTPVEITLSTVAGQELTKATLDVAWTSGQEQTTALGLLPSPTRDAAGTAESFLVTARIPGDSLARDDAATSPVRARARLDVFILAQASTRAGEGRIDSYGPAEWLSLCLAPQADDSERRRLDADIRVTLLDPTITPQLAALAEADAVMVPRPDLLDATGWARVKDALAAGAFVLISPPPDAALHLWADGLKDMGSLKWEFAREAVVHATPLKLSPERTMNEGSDPLALLAAEIEELVKPVTVTRTLGVSGPRGAFDTVLSLSDGSPLLITARPDSGTEGSRGGVLAFLATAIDLRWSDLPTKPLMLPLVQELVRQGVGSGRDGAASTAGQRPAMPRGCVELIELRVTENARSISASAGATEQSVRRAGVFVAKGPAGETLALVAVNPDGAGADVESISSEEVTRWFTQTGMTVASLGGQSSDGAALATDAPRELPVSLPLLVLAALLGVCEMFMARAFSHASVAKA